MDGIDVSNNNGTIDWRSVADSGVQFAIAKATEGDFFHDAVFPRNWNDMRSVGLVRGAYHFARPSSGDAINEAEWFLDYLVACGGLLPGDMVALDMEDEQFAGDVGPWTMSWLEYVSNKLGFSPLLYTGPWYISSRSLNNHSELGRYPLWLASYQSTQPRPPIPWNTVSIWQNSSSGSIPGVSGDCDTDIYQGDRNGLLMLGMPSLISTPPGPTVDPRDSTIGYLSHDVADALQKEHDGIVDKLDALQAAINTLRRGGANA